MLIEQPCSSFSALQWLLHCNIFSAVEFLECILQKLVFLSNKYQSCAMQSILTLFFKALYLLEKKLFMFFHCISYSATTARSSRIRSGKYTEVNWHANHKDKLCIIIKKGCQKVCLPAIDLQDQRPSYLKTFRTKDSSKTLPNWIRF